MLHDTRLATAETPPLDPRRALEIEVFAHYVSQVLRSQTAALPFDASRRLVRKLEAAGAATVRRGEDVTSIQLLGLTARTNSSDYALLSNWLTAAYARIAPNTSGGRA